MSQLASDSGSSCGGGGGAMKPATGNKAARKASEAAASGSSGDATIKSQKVAEGDKAEAGKAKRMWTVTEEYIDRLRKEKAAGGPKVRNFDYLNDRTGPGAEALRELAARGAAVIAEIEAHKARILQDYDTYGSAQVEVEEFPSVDNEMYRKVMAWSKKVQQMASSGSRKQA